MTPKLPKLKTIATVKTFEEAVAIAKKDIPPGGRVWFQTADGELVDITERKES